MLSRLFEGPDLPSQFPELEALLQNPFRKPSE